MCGRSILVAPQDEGKLIGTADLVARSAKTIRGVSAAARRGGAVLGDNVGSELVFDEGDAIAEPQFAFFQPLNLQEVRPRRLL